MSITVIGHQSLLDDLFTLHSGPAALCPFCTKHPRWKTFGEAREAVSEGARSPSSKRARKRKV